MSYRRFQFDGGAVEYVVDGPTDARGLLLFHVGTPSAAVVYPGLVKAAAAHGLRTATYSRGGYGRSSRREGRSVADEAAISAALASHLGHERFLTAGWSGGGPVALACAALLPDRVPACLTLASLAPRVEAGAAAWARWNSAEQLAEWDALASGDLPALIADFEGAVEMFSHVTARRLHAIGGPPDARAIAHGHASEIVPSARQVDASRRLDRLLRLPRRQPRPGARLGVPRRGHPRAGRRSPRASSTGWSTSAMAGGLPTRSRARVACSSRMPATARSRCPGRRWSRTWCGRPAALAAIGARGDV